MWAKKRPLVVVPGVKDDGTAYSPESEGARAYAQGDLREQRKALQAFCDKWRSQEPGTSARFEAGLERSCKAQQIPPLLRNKLSSTNLCKNLFRQSGKAPRRWEHPKPHSQLSYSCLLSYARKPVSVSQEELQTFPSS